MCIKCQARRIKKRVAKLMVTLLLFKILDQLKFQQLDLISPILLKI